MEFPFEDDGGDKSRTQSVDCGEDDTKKLSIILNLQFDEKERKTKINGRVLWKSVVGSIDPCTNSTCCSDKGRMGEKNESNNKKEKGSVYFFLGR